MAYFKAVDGKTKEESIPIYKEYILVSDIIETRELQLAAQGILMSG